MFVAQFCRAARRFAVACAVALPLTAHAAAPCLTPTPACTEWLPLPGSPMRALVYRTHALDARDETVTRAVVVVHGGGRDAHTNFLHVLTAGFVAGTLNDTLVVSPRFASNHEAIAQLLTGEDAVAAARAPARDAIAANELNFVSQFGPRHWNAGGVAANANVTSYEVIDEALRRLADRTRFPNLRHIVVAGHSSGGQFVGRYHFVNRVHESLGVKVSYIVSNPGAYTYLDERRPTPAALPHMSSSVPGFIELTPQPAGQAAFRAFADARNCTQFDQWPYGMKNRQGYAAQASDEQLVRQIVSRPATWVLGELDILPLVNFDVSCPAVAQGNSRLSRGLAFTRYLREHFQARHHTVVLDGCGHSTRCMLTHDRMLPVLFPKE